MWIDSNHDGIHQTDEPPAENTFANLYQCNGKWVDTTWSNESGMCKFSNISEGVYFVVFLLPSHKCEYILDCLHDS